MKKAYCSRRSQQRSSRSRCRLQAPLARRQGGVYTITNAARQRRRGFSRSDRRHRSRSWRRTATGGNGTGANLGSQGAVALSDDGKLLFAVNAGSNSISEFAVREHGLSS